MSKKRHRTAAAIGASAAVFTALGDETRLRLIARLSEGGPMSIAGLAEALRYLQQISDDWDDKLRRLKNLVESKG